MRTMEHLVVRRFGPITEAELDFRKVTVLIGRQGSGKSTLAKLYSLFVWLEKCLTRHSMTEKYIMQYSRFRNKFCAFNAISEYFRVDTYIRFDGNHYTFIYEGGALQVESLDRQGEVMSYRVSKVMYVPAERSILGTVDHTSRLCGLTEPMQIFLEEFDRAKQTFRNGYHFPFENVEFVYDTLNDMPRLRHSGGETKLSSGSSGFQSSLPLLLVSRNLTDMVVNSSRNAELTEQERKNLQREVERILHDKALSEEVRAVSLRSISSRYTYSRFVNIVEEMELNLFPDSQSAVLYELIADANTLEANGLVLTTHSPYLIDYLTLSVKAAALSRKYVADSELCMRVSRVVPAQNQVGSDDVAIYQLGQGEISRLPMTDGIPSDANFLNDGLRRTNELFDELLEIEEKAEWKG